MFHLLWRSTVYIFKPGRALISAWARYFSSMGHSRLIWVPLALEIDSLCFYACACSQQCTHVYLRSISHFRAIWVHFLWRSVFYFFTPGRALNTVRTKHLSSMGHFRVIRVPLLWRLIVYVLMPGLTLKSVRTRYFSSMGHFIIIWVPLALEIICLCVYACALNSAHTCTLEQYRSLQGHLGSTCFRHTLDFIAIIQTHKNRLQVV